VRKKIVYVTHYLLTVLCIERRMEGKQPMIYELKEELYGKMERQDQSKEFEYKEQIDNIINEKQYFNKLNCYTNYNKYFNCSMMF